VKSNGQPKLRARVMRAVILHVPPTWNLGKCTVCMRSGPRVSAQPSPPCLSDPPEPDDDLAKPQ
jgi:hypothetical protein